MLVMIGLTISTFTGSVMSETLNVEAHLRADSEAGQRADGADCWANALKFFNVSPSRDVLLMEVITNLDEEFLDNVIF